MYQIIIEVKNKSYFPSERWCGCQKGIFFYTIKIIELWLKPVNLT